jgi:hypothetical protein
MNDLNLLEDFRADLPPADPATLARARARMFQAPATPRPRRRLAWGLVPAGALVCAAVVGAVALRPPQATRPAVNDGPAAAAPTDAARVLRLAAAEARKEPELTARPDQFVYAESLVAWAGGEGRRDGTMKYIPPIEKNRRIWLSVDGTRDGLLREKASHPADAAAHPRRVLTDMPLAVQGSPIPAYLRNLPTDVTGMRAYLYDVQNSKNLPADRLAWTKIGDTLREQYVPPASVAALFEAAATIAGTTVVKQVDLSGRKGTAVSRTDEGLRHDLIFDAEYRFLGERDVVVGNSPPFPKGAVIGWTAQLRIAIVDRTGQLP